MKLQSNIKILLYLFFVIVVHLTLKSQTVMDYDGNVYKTITIGNQTWIAENMRTTHYSDGTMIEDGKNFNYYPEEIVYCLGLVDSTKYYFYYNDISSLAEQYGCLYNWYAAVNVTSGNDQNINNVQGICPIGWHIPNKQEYEQLLSYAGENSFEKLLNGGETGFNALYGGFRSDEQRLFFGLGTSGSYLTSSPVENNECYITLFEFHSSEENVIFRGHTKTCGYSVRCIKDMQSNYINNNQLGSKCNIYPNPCSDILYINSQENYINKIDIYSLDNKRVKTTKLKGSNEISVSEIDPGLYIIKIYLDDFVFSNKLIIK